MRKLTPSGAPPSTHWYETAGLGMFIHWGLSSVRAVGDLSWCMIKDTPYDAELENRTKLTPEEYWKQADEFDPDRYDPDLCFFLLFRNIKPLKKGNRMVEHRTGNHTMSAWTMTPSSPVRRQGNPKGSFPRGKNLTCRLGLFCWSPSSCSSSINSVDRHPGSDNCELPPRSRR